MPRPYALARAATLAVTVILASCVRVDRDPAQEEHLDSATGGIANSAPHVGRVRITGLLINPATVPDSLGEWIEIRNASPETVDMSGWTLSSGHGDRGYTFPPGAILISGGRFDLGRSTDPAKTGGIHVKYLVQGITLDDTNDWLAVHDLDGHTVDSVYWASSQPDQPISPPRPREAATKRAAADAPPAPIVHPTRRP